MIKKENIVAFISTLYEKRYDTPVPAELLNKWSNLDNAEIEKNLQALFAHWGFTPQQGQREIDDFLKTRVQSGITPHDFVPTPTKKKRRFPLPYILFIALLAGGAYVAYQYMQYSNLKTVYCLTDNVTLRLEDGKKVGRMDLFEGMHNDVTSYTKLLATDNGTVLKKFPDLKKEIAVRELYLLDNFWIYLKGGKGAKAYASSAYLTESKQEFELFKSVFKNVAQNRTENAKLRFAYRKVIVGCLRISKQTERKVELPCDGSYAKNLDGICCIDLGKGKYQAIAKLNDGKYYHFVGNTKSNEFAKIKVVQTMFEFLPNSEMNNDFLFKVNRQTAALYDCDGKSQHLYSEAISETNPQIKNFEWFCPL